MSSLSQTDRQIIITTPLGEDTLVVKQFTAYEAMGRLFEYQLELLSEDHNIAINEILGQNVSLTLQLEDERDRYFNGFVTRFAQVGQVGRHALYQATLRPWLWFLTRSSDCRIFQETSVPDIIKTVFRDFGFSDFEDRLSASYRTWDYCVQYRESAFDFVSRLMEHEGIYYYFRHEEGKHILVLADAYGAHEQFEGYETLPYFPETEDGVREQEHVYGWALAQEIQATTYTLDDYDFERPRTDLLARSTIGRQHAYSEYEVFDYPGKYTVNGDGDQRVRVGIEGLQSQFERADGHANARGLMAGGLFTLAQFPREDQNKEYLVLSSTIHVQAGGYEGGEGDQAFSFHCRFNVCDAQQPFRSARSTPKPVVQGPQTAVVVGPSGEPMWTDQYGRVKVQFHWDRYGGADENSSCWVRVSQMWAGRNWGAMHMPHIGQEVIVSFLEGDPDRPIITGRVYNADNMPPESLPDQQTKSVWSDPGGNEIVMNEEEGGQTIHAKQQCGNELVMDGSSGAEQIRLQDKYGNKLLLDAVEGTATLHSPTHDSWVVLGRSVNWNTASDWLTSIGGDTDIKHGGDVKFDMGKDWHLNVGSNVNHWYGGDVKFNYDGTEVKIHGGLVSDTFIGGKHSALIGGQFTTNLAILVERSKSKTLKKVDSLVKIDSQTETQVIGGGGEADTSKVHLRGDFAKLRSGESEIIIRADKTIILNSNTDVEIVAEDDVSIQTPGNKVVIECDKVEFKCKTIDFGKAELNGGKKGTFCS